MIEHTITKYEAVDGKIFDNEDECLDYENRVCQFRIYNDEMAQRPVDAIDTAVYVVIPNQESLQHFKKLSDWYECSTNGITGPGVYKWIENAYVNIDDIIKNRMEEIEKLKRFKEEL